LSFEALAADYIAEIRAVQPEGPYHLGGYSSGGLIAFEIARQLAAAGQAVALVALLDSYAPSAPGQAATRSEAVRNLAASLPYWLRDLTQLERKQIWARVRRRRRAAQHGAAALTAADYLGEDNLAALPPRHRAFIDAHWQALAAYQPQPYAGRVTLFRAQAQALSRAADPHKGWSALAQGGVDLREFPGSHRTLLSEPYAAGLASVLQAKLDELQPA
jgi:thioesterase domain-containing protein